MKDNPIKLVETSFAAQTQNLQSAAPSSVDNHKNPDVKPCGSPNAGIKPK